MAHQFASLSHNTHYILTRFLIFLCASFLLPGFVYTQEQSEIEEISAEISVTTTLELPCNGRKPGEKCTLYINGINNCLDDYFCDSKSGYCCPDFNAKDNEALSIVEKMREINEMNHCNGKSSSGLCNLENNYFCMSGYECNMNGFCCLSEPDNPITTTPKIKFDRKLEDDLPCKGGPYIGMCSEANNFQCPPPSFCDSSSLHCCVPELPITPFVSNTFCTGWKGVCSIGSSSTCALGYECDTNSLVCCPKAQTLSNSEKEPLREPPCGGALYSDLCNKQNNFICSFGYRCELSSGVCCPDNFDSRRATTVKLLKSRSYDKNKASKNLKQLLSNAMFSKKAISNSNGIADSLSLQCGISEINGFCSKREHYKCPVGYLCDKSRSVCCPSNVSRYTSTQSLASHTLEECPTSTCPVQKRCVCPIVQKLDCNSKIKSALSDSSKIAFSDDNNNFPKVRLKLYSKPQIPWETRNEFNDCSTHCTWTNDDNVDGFVFSVPTHDGNFPVKKNGQVFISLCLEAKGSNGHCSKLNEKDYFDQFDLHSNFSITSDIPAFYTVPSEEELYKEVPEKKINNFTSFVSSSVFYVVLLLGFSYQCLEPRTSTIRQLMEFLPVSSFGNCLQNTNIVDDQGVESLLITIGAYKFNLAFENENEPYYVTEKFWNCFRAGTVPVYFGSDSVKKLAPGVLCSIFVTLLLGDHSFIFANDFKSLKDLAAYLKVVGGNDVLYNEYFDWKKKPLNAEFKQIQRLDFSTLVCRICKKVAEMKVKNMLDYDTKLNEEIKDFKECPNPSCPPIKPCICERFEVPDASDCKKSEVALLPGDINSKVSYAHFFYSSVNIAELPTVTLKLYPNAHFKWETKNTFGDCSSYCTLSDSVDDMTDAIVFPVASHDGNFPVKRNGQLFISLCLEPMTGADASCSKLSNSDYFNQFDLHSNYSLESDIPGLFPVPSDDLILQESSKKSMKFYLAREPTKESSYVSDKFWKGFKAGLLPVYIGGDSVKSKNMFPGKHSYINAADFESSSDLNKYLNLLDRYDSLYQEYFEWKKSPLNPEFKLYQKLDWNSLTCRICKRVSLTKKYRQESKLSQ